MIPFTFSKTIEVLVTVCGVEDATENVVSALANRINAEKPRSCSSSQSQVVFSGGPFSVPNPRWNILGPITRGEISVVSDRNKLRISYKLWYTELLILASLLTILVLYIAQNLWVAAVAWLGFNIGNYLISAARFDSLVYSALNKLDMIAYNDYGSIKDNA